MTTDRKLTPKEKDESPRSSREGTADFANRFEISRAMLEDYSRYQFDD